VRFRLAPTGSARRRLLRSMLSRFPWIGESYLLPMVVLFYEMGPMWPWYRRLFAIRETRRINRAIDAGVERVCLVYDCGVCPLTYGDYLQFVMIMRYFGERGTRATMYILDSEISPAHRDVKSDQEIEEFLQDLIEIGESLLSYPEVQAERVHDFQELMELTDSQDLYVVCAWRTRNRRPLFHHGWNMFNHLMASLPSELQDRVLLSSSDFAQFGTNLDVPSPRVAWHARYSSDIDLVRNLTNEEFLEIHEIIRIRYPDYSILIVSDDAGCQHYSEVARANGLDQTVFSKDYSSSYLGDAALVLESDLYCALRGGGMSIVALMSRLPYRIANRIVHYERRNGQPFTSWQDQTQQFLDEEHLSGFRAMLMS